VYYTICYTSPFLNKSGSPLVCFHPYGKKKGRKSKCQFDSRPLKVKNHLELHVCKRHATYCWKSFDESYKFALDFTSIRGIHNKLWVSKMAGVLISRIVGRSIWESKEKNHFKMVACDASRLNRKYNSRLPPTSLIMN
jgi:hypothetical protein